MDARGKRNSLKQGPRSARWSAAFALLLPVAVHADDPGQRVFADYVHGILRQHCYECHSHDAGKAKGGLVLDSRAGWQNGGNSGPAIVPGDVDASLLWEVVSYEDIDSAMPPNGKLPAEDLRHIREWIELGAPDPRVSAMPGMAEDGPVSADELWSLQPLSELSELASIDTIHRHRLAVEEMDPASRADRITLLRRLFLDLSGLPPTLKEIEQFQNAPLEEVIDALLKSPHFGERWGRHWLDLARYAESNGLDRDMSYNEAWRYRKWVVDALNDDMPFDQFVREQIAGDLLPAPDLETRHRQLIATGFLAIGPKPLQMGEIVDVETADEILETVGKAFLGQSITCARCHDHKFDPISQRDYFAMSGIFQSTRLLFGYQAEARELKEPVLDELLIQLSPPKVIQEARALQSQHAELFEAHKASEDDAEKERLAQRMSALLETAPDLDATIGVADRAQVFHAQWLAGGDPDNAGEERVPRGFLSQVEFDGAPELDPQQSGRRDLADWIAHPDNPLTARVAVNRIWHHLFGRGLVESVDNLGSTGTGPTQAALLDYLARRFIELGWSRKALIREIVLSDVYQATSRIEESHAEEHAIDPDNRTVWRMSPKRLEAEVIRDSLLVSSGLLDRNPQFRSPMDDLGWVSFSGNNQTGDPAPILEEFETARYRSIYLPVLRSYKPEVFTVFDFPSPDFARGAREVTTVPAQSLYLMNSTFVVECAENLAALEAVDDQDKIREIWQRILTRPPSEQEAETALAAIEEFRKTSPENAWATWVQMLYLHAEFRELY